MFEFALSMSCKDVL